MEYLQQVENALNVEEHLEEFSEEKTLLDQGGNRVVRNPVSVRVELGLGVQVLKFSWGLFHDHGRYQMHFGFNSTISNLKRHLEAANLWGHQGLEALKEDLAAQKLELDVWDGVIASASFSDELESTVLSLDTYETRTMFRFPSEKIGKLIIADMIRLSQMTPPAQDLPQ